MSLEESLRENFGDLYDGLETGILMEGSLNSYWKLNGDTITLFGDGAFISMAASFFPWRNVDEHIIKVHIASGVTSISSYGFYDYDNLVEVKIEKPDKEGIGELLVKGPSVMLEYFENKEATKKSIIDDWFYTGDLAKIDEEGYIYICGRKKSVIVLKNGKNIFPEEMENLVNKIEGVKESFIFGKQQSDDKDDIKINVKLVFDREIVEEVYKVKTDDEIYKVLSNKIKEINKIMPSYKAIRGILITEEELIKTTTNKIKRQANLDAIEKSNN